MEVEIEIIVRFNILALVELMFLLHFYNFGEYTHGYVNEGQKDSYH